MAYYDWRDLADDVTNIINDAVETRDFQALNENVRSVIRNVTDPGSSRSYQEPRGGTYANQGSGAGYGNANANQSAQNGYARNPNSYGPQNSRPQNSLFKRTGFSQLIALAAAACGLVLAGGCALMLLGFLLTGAQGAFFNPVAWFLILFFFCMLAAGAAAFFLGGSYYLRVRRFGRYRKCIGNRTCVNLTELARAVNKSVKYVRKDVARLIRKHWFLEGHMDEEQTCLMTDNWTYDQYLLVCEHRRELQQEEEKARRKAQEEEEAARARKESSPELAEILEEGNRYIERIHACNDAIPGEEISEKISRMEHLIRRIFDRVEQHPEVIPDIRRLMQYYLPTTVKLLDAYAELDDQPIDGEHIQSSRKEIEDTLDTLNMAYEKLLDSLFRDTAWDVSSDISVLKTMLAQEGLTEDDFAQSKR